MKKSEVVIYIVLVVVLLAVIGRFVTQDTKERQQYTDSVMEERNSLKELQNKKQELEQKLTDLEKAYQEKMVEKTCVVLCFEQMNSNLFDEIYPLIKEYGYKGTFLLEDESKIGKKGCLTREEYENLLEAGWQPVTAKEKENYIDSLELKTARIREKDALVKGMLEECLQDKTSAVVTTRYMGKAVKDPAKDCGTQRYTYLLDWLKTQNANLYVKTFEETETCLNEVKTAKEEYETEWQDEKKDIENQIYDLEYEIQEKEKSQ